MLATLGRWNLANAIQQLRWQTAGVAARIPGRVARCCVAVAQPQRPAQKLQQLPLIHQRIGVIQVTPALHAEAPRSALLGRCSRMPLA